MEVALNNLHYNIQSVASLYTMMKINQIKDLPPVKDWLMERRRLMPFSVQRALWLSPISAVVLSGIMALGAIKPHSLHFEENFHFVYMCISNLMLFISLYTYNFWILRKEMDDKKAVTAGLVGSLLIAVVYTPISFFMERAVCSTTTNTYAVTLIITIAAAVITYLIALLMSNVTRQQQMLAENEHLRAENLRTHYETLEQQVSPHFLFNSLNTLDGLIGIDDERAHQYLRHLAQTYRYTLQQRQLVTLAEELEFAHNYLNMMQIRYGNTLHVEEHVEPSALNLNLPPISLQLLLENVIKHNVVSQRHPLTITIASGTASITVCNTKQPKQDAGESHGIGLANLAERYRMLAGREITIVDNEDKFAVELPLI